MQRLEVSGAVRPIYGPLGVKRLTLCAEVGCFGVAHLMGVIITGAGETRLQMIIK